MLYRRAPPHGRGLCSASHSLCEGAWRMVWEYWQRPSTRAEPVIVFGAGAGGRQVIDGLSGSDSPYRVVGLLDDHPSMQNVRIRSLRVSGTGQEMGSQARRTGAKTLLIATVSTRIQELSRPALALALELRVLPPVSRLFADCGRTRRHPTGDRARPAWSPTDRHRS